MNYIVVLENEEKAIKLYYVGYGERGGGLILTEHKDDAYQFPREDYAKNVIGGDVRLQGAKVEALSN